MARGDIMEFLKSDTVSYGVGIPVVAGVYIAGATAMGVPAAAAAVPSLLFSGATVGFIRGLAGWEQTSGMTKMELERAAGISVIGSVFMWAASNLGQITQAKALVKAADDAAKSTAAAAGNGFGKSVMGFLGYWGQLFAGMLASIAVAELAADLVRR